MLKSTYYQPVNYGDDFSDYLYPLWLPKQCLHVSLVCFWPGAILPSVVSFFVCFTLSVLLDFYYEVD